MNERQAILIGAIALLHLLPTSADTSCTNLSCAIFNGNSVLVAALLEAGIDPSAEIAVDASNQSETVPPLVIALQRGQDDIAIQLLAAGADPSLGDTSRMTILDLAASRGSARVVKYILAQNLLPVDGYRTDKKTFIPLGQAAGHGHREVVKALLESGADPYATTMRDRLTVIDEPIALGHEHITRVFLDHGFDLGRVSATSDALHLAAANTNHAIVEHLTKSGWDVNREIGNNATALEQAMLNCRHQERIALHLIESGANVCGVTLAGNSLFEDELIIQKKGLTILSPLTLDALRKAGAQCWPTDRGKQDHIRFGLPNGPCSDSLSGHDKIDCAIENNHVGVLDELSSKSISRYLSEHGDLGSLIEKALLRDSQESISYVMDRSSNYCSLVGKLPILHRALVLGRFRVVNSLLSQGQLCPTEHGLSELHLRTLDLDYYGVRTALENGELPDNKDQFGFTPIMFALALGAEDIAFLLLENGARLDQQTRFNHSLLHFAAIGDAHFFGKNGIEYPTHDFDLVDAIDKRTPLLTAIAGECSSGLVSHLIWSKSNRCQRDMYGRKFWDYIKENTKRPERRNWLRAFDKPGNDACLQEG